MQEIFGLRYEFVYRHGHYMELHREQGIAPEELSELQLRMLESNKIPRLLPIVVHEMDFKISLLYHLTGKRMLSHVMKSEGVTSHNAAKLLYSIVCAIDESKNYMLTETHYVLKDNFIFIGSDWSDVYLTYLPLKLPVEQAETLVQLKSFISELAGKNQTSWGADGEELLQTLTSCPDLSHCKRKLLGFMDEIKREGDARKEAYGAESKAGEADEAEAAGLRDSSFDQTSHRTQQPKQRSSLPGPVHQADKAGDSSHVPERPESNQPPKYRLPHEALDLPVRSHQRVRQVQRLSRRAKTILLAGCMLAAAFLWQDYAYNPLEAHLRIYAGVTILLGDLWFAASWIGIPRQRNKPSASSADLALADDTSRRAANRDESVENVVSSWRESVFASPSTAQPGGLDQYYQNLHLHTALLHAPEPNETVFLGSAVQKAQGPRLETMQDGRTHTILLHHNSFTIGRGGSEAQEDHTLEEAGVSRLHAEISSSNDEFAIKDLGSTNGTLLNGNPLVPYQLYELKPGDTIRIVRTEFIFHT